MKNIAHCQTRKHILHSKNSENKRLRFAAFNNDTCGLRNYDDKTLITKSSYAPVDYKLRTR